jgi:hypothetical protein
MTTVKFAETGEMLPARSVAVAVKVYEPASRVVAV